MTLYELMDWATRNGVSFDTPIAIAHKDDYLLTEDKIRLSNSPYFGNCRDGGAYLNRVAPKNEDGDVDYENLPTFIMLSTGY